jgi:uroporphyrinogen-III decarboxylase
MADGSDFRQPKPSPFTDLEQIYSLDPFEEYGRVDHKQQAAEYQAWYREARKGPGVISGGTYKSVISFAIDALGWDNLLAAAGVDPERFGRLLNRWADYLMQYVEAWAATDIEVYLTHDDMVWTSGGFLRPEFYRRYVFPNLRRYWDCVRSAGKKVLFCSDGCFTEYVDDLAAAGAEGFIFEPLTSLEKIVAKYGKTHVIMGNADTRVLTFGPGTRSGPR